MEDWLGSRCWYLYVFGVDKRMWEINKGAIVITAAATAVEFTFEHVRRTHGKRLYVYSFESNEGDCQIYMGFDLVFFAVVLKKRTCEKHFQLTYNFNYEFHCVSSTFL